MELFSTVILLVTTCFCHVYCGDYHSENNIQDLYYWKDVQFENLPLKEESYVGPYPYFIPTNNAVVGSGYHAQSGLMIVTIGRIREGVPSTLNAFCTTDYKAGSSPYIWGFPDYRTNTLQPTDYSDIKRVRRNATDNPDSDLKHKKPYYGYYNSPDFRIISVYHPTIDDRCNRLFVIDTGTMRTTDDGRYWVQPPALVVYDLPSNGCVSRNFQVLRRVELPQSVWNDPLGFDYVTVDYQSKGGCDDIILYFDNIFDNSIVVYDYVKNDFWMFANHSSFVPVISESYVLEKYVLPYGVMNIALGWPDKKGNKIAYYAPGASTGEYAVTTKTLKNRRKQPPYGNEFRLIGYHGCKGSIHRQFFDSNSGVMFFAHMASGEVRCWYVGKPFNPNNLEVIFHPEEFELFTDVYVDSEGYLWMHSGQLHVALSTVEPLDLSKVNSRIRKVKVLDAIEGTVCENYGGLQQEIAWKYLCDL